MNNFRRLPAASLVSLLLIMGGVGLLGANSLRNSSAATAWTNHTPYGSIDSCALTNNHTYIYGWANDPEALHNNASLQPYVNIKVGSQTQRVATEQSAYHSNAIDNYIAANFPNQPVSSSFSPRRDYYGFIASFDNLYKGNSYSVSGVANNYPTDNSDGGSDHALSVNTSGTTIGGWAAPSFAGGVVPNSCLLTAPTPTLTLTASPTTVIRGAATTLTWSSQNTNSCTASGSWTDGKKPNDSYTTGPLTANASFTLTCNGYSPGLTVQKTVNITVTAPPSNGGSTGGGSSGGGSGGSNSGAGTTTTKHSGSPNTSTATPSSAADATVTAGTNSVDIQIPAGNAAKVYISFNPDASPAVPTSEQTMYSNGITVHIPDLSAKTTYNYTITRTNSAGAKATSPSKTFTTTGYEIALNFVNKNGDPVADIAGTIDDTKNTESKSDDEGIMSFKDLADGIYTISYEYKKNHYTSSFDTASSPDTSSADPTTAHTVVLGDTIDVDSLEASAAKKPAKSSGGGAAWVIIFALLVIGVIVFIIIRRRRSQQFAFPDYPAAVPPPVPVIDDTAAKQFAKKQAEAGPPPEHMGESLRDMVIKSMHEEAQKRKQQPPDDQPK